MARLHLAAFVAVALAGSTLASQACAARNHGTDSCIAKCQSRWGYTGAAHGQDRWGSVLKPTTDVKDVVIAEACGVSTEAYAPASALPSPSLAPIENVAPRPSAIVSSASVVVTSSVQLSSSAVPTTSSVPVTSSRAVPTSSAAPPPPAPSPEPELETVRIQSIPEPEEEEEPARIQRVKEVASPSPPPAPEPTPEPAPPPPPSPSPPPAPEPTPEPAPPPAPSPSPSPPPAPAPAPGNGGGGGTSAGDVAEYLKGHNTIRAQHGASPLTFSEELASAAQEWANKCVFEHSGGSLGPFGENLAAGSGDSYSIATAIKSWTDEVKDYNPSNPTPSHFTQVVWKDTAEVGCAVALCDGIFAASFGKAKYFVCEYRKQGNVTGRFGQNVQV